MSGSNLRLLDCTLRDGGYYNSWDFSPDLISQYIDAMLSAGVDIVEIGFRSLNNRGFRGASAFTTDDFLESLNIPKDLMVGVMVNGSDLTNASCLESALFNLFPKDSARSPVDLVRIACHVEDLRDALPASVWLKKCGFLVGFNVMQITNYSADEIRDIARLVLDYPLDVLYFADSTGSMNPDNVSRIIKYLRSNWDGDIGIHTHDNMGLALSNTLCGLEQGVTWVDSTVTGMGRGPGNARTEELVIEIAELRGQQINIIPLMGLLRKHFKPMQTKYGWGSNPYYYLSGKYGIHPGFVQEMLGDSRYTEVDLMSVIDYLRKKGGKKFCPQILTNARNFYSAQPVGHWSPKSHFLGKDVLLLGSGLGVAKYRDALERFIKKNSPLVLALNTQSSMDSHLIDFRVACHPLRLLADCAIHNTLPQPLITPYSMLPLDVQESLGDKKIFDFGITVKDSTFSFEDNYCTVPAPLVIGYALAIATSGGSSNILLAGFDGYGSDDPRTLEMHQLFEHYQSSKSSLPIVAVTPSCYKIPSQSIYAL